MRKAAKNKEFVVVFIGERKIETSLDVFPLNRFKTTIKKEMKIEIREMVSFELGKEIEKDVFSSCHERGTAMSKAKCLLIEIREMVSF